MNVAITTAAPPVFIDLTQDDAINAHITPKTPRSSSGLPVKHVSVYSAAQQPLAKRRRVHQAKHHDYKPCIRKLLVPHVEGAVARLPSADYLVDQIAIKLQATEQVLKTTDFLRRVEAAPGTLSNSQQTEIKERVALVVKELAALPEFQKQRPELENHSPSKPLTPAASQARHVRTSEASTPWRPCSGSIKVPPPRARPRHATRYEQVGRRPATHTCSWPQRKPYLDAQCRDEISRGILNFHIPRAGDPLQSSLPATYHVDITPAEIDVILKTLGQKVPSSSKWTTEDVSRIPSIPNVVSLVSDALPGRSETDLRRFCLDVRSGVANLQNPQALSLQRSGPSTQGREGQSRTCSLLFARELEGNVGFGRMRQYQNFQQQFQLCLEDSLSVIAEFTNCAGDISAVSWVPNDNVICGTTAHSDAHNQQYNKPGNLLLLTRKGTLQAFPDHKIPRPRVEKGDNSTEAMRQSQDPWLYSSVVSTDFDEATGLAFTSSFDQTVKVWEVSEDSMRAIATWHHTGNVNFVAVAKDGSGRVATAADVPTSAIRIYRIDRNDAQNSPYDSIACARTDVEGSDKWAYCPATMQWGRAPGTQHLLAIGYSPRSFSGDDADIPEDKVHTGKIVLWDADLGRKVPVLTMTTANVFELVWHPSAWKFIVATSPSGTIIEPGTRTNIHIFQIDVQRQDGAYCEVQKLDCPASDINEVTMMPNSLRHAYVAAACTDGRVYVWDTSQGDRPIHVLKHGRPLEDFAPVDREREDTGVKFTAWGATTDRLYTGSSDGVVKVWNIRRQRQPLERILLEAPGPISCGVFSPNHSKLVIGDATGRVFLLSVDKRDEVGSCLTTLSGNRRVRRPKPFTPHAEPAPPPPSTAVVAAAAAASSSYSSITQYSREKYLVSQQLVLHPNPVIGVVQGPAYSSTGFFRRDAHVSMNPLGPLLPDFERQQRSTRDTSLGPRSRSLRRLREPLPASDSWTALRHEINVAQDLDISALPQDIIEELERDGAELYPDGDEGWDLEYDEMPALFDELVLIDD